MINTHQISTINPTGTDCKIDTPKSIMLIPPICMKIVKHLRHRNTFNNPQTLEKGFHILNITMTYTRKIF